MAKKNSEHVSDLKVGGIVSTDKVEFSPRSARVSEYQPVADKMGELKAGQTLLIPVPNGLDAKTFQTRMTASLRRIKPDAPTGCTFRSYITKDEKNIGITCNKSV